MRPVCSPLRRGLLSHQVAFASAPARNIAFSEVSDNDIAIFERLVPGGVVTDVDTLAPMNSDWLGRFHGRTRVAVRPKTTEEVSAVLAHCNERRLAVCPQGGNTGLVGGSVPVHDEVVLSLSRMNKVESFDADAGVVVAEAGCILESLDDYVKEHGFLMPLDLGAKGSCQIGGNISTNAGGLRLLRYGSLHGTVLGLEVVLADGTILDMMSTLRKDNTGYDLKQLFIGAEGTLGVVTKAAVLTPARSTSINLALLGCESYDAVVAAYNAAKPHLGEILSACELIDRGSLAYSLDHLGERDPLECEHPFYFLVETSGSNEEHDMEKMECYLETVLGSVVTDGTIAQDGKQTAGIWALREGIATAMTATRCVYKYDVSLPVKVMYDIVPAVQARLPEGCDAIGYGHIGDGNIHLNVGASEYSDEVQNAIEPFVYEWTASHRGSISAEHGLGLQKANKIHYSKGAAAIATMKAVKNQFDPHGILNPYKVLPNE